MDKTILFTCNASLSKSFAIIKSMKKILICSFLLFFVNSAAAEVRSCGFSMKKGPSSFLDVLNRTSDSNRIDVPEGKCKLIPNDFLRENDLYCENVLEAFAADGNKLAKKYDCYQPALGRSFKMENGRGVSSSFTLCYICKSGSDKKDKYLF